MPIKLIQVQRKLNVGIATVVEFLQRKGFETENNPNTRISDEQYALLVKEFGKDLPKQDQAKESHPRNDQKAKQHDRPQEIKTVIPDEYKPKIVTKGRIDLDGEQKTAQAVASTPAPAPEVVKKEVKQTEKAEKEQAQVVVNKAEETVNIEKKGSEMSADKAAATTGG